MASDLEIITMTSRIMQLERDARRLRKIASRARGDAAQAKHDRQMGRMALSTARSWRGSGRAAWVLLTAGAHALAVADAMGLSADRVIRIAGEWARANGAVWPPEVRGGAV